MDERLEENGSFRVSRENYWSQKLGHSWRIDKLASLCAVAEYGMSDGAPLVVPLSEKFGHNL